MASLTKEDGLFYDIALNDVIEEARRVQKLFKGSSKAASALHSVEEGSRLAVVLPVVTRWSSNVSCVRRYDKLFNKLRLAFLNDDCPQLDPAM